jgi:hypothetical protein
VSQFIHIQKSFMPKKKTKKRVSGTRRKKHGVGAAKGAIEHYALLGIGAVAGGVAAAFGIQALNTALGSATASAPWLPPALTMGAGGVFAVATKGHALGLGAGLGMAAVGGVMLANQTFLNIPGISGMSMTSNAPAGSPVIRKSVGQGPNKYINQTVGRMGKYHRAMGALGSN